MSTKSKKRKLEKGQQQLIFHQNTLASTNVAADATTTSTNDREETKGMREETAGRSWRRFAEVSWKNKYPWLIVKSDGIYCLYCTHSNASSKGSSAHYVERPRSSF